MTELIADEYDDTTARLAAYWPRWSALPCASDHEAEVLAALRPDIAIRFTAGRR